jgi:SAM-dependent methyltransferase
MYLATRQAEDRLWWYHGMWQISRCLLDRYIHRRDLDILDAGCGTGGTMVQLGAYGCVTGVDLSDLALELTRQRGRCRLARASITQLPFPDHSFDLVTSFDVLYHLWVDDQLALSELHRVLRPGGHALLRVAANDWLRGQHDRAGYTRQRYSRGELREKVERAGLREVVSSYANSLLFPLAAVKRLTDRFDGHADLGEEGDVSANDLAIPPGPLNFALEKVLSLEAELVARSALPIGLSIITLAQKPGTDQRLSA